MAQVETSNMRRSVEVEILSAGQPRAYADSRYEAILRFTTPENQAWSSKFPVVAEQVKPYVRLMVRDFKDEPGWADPRLRVLEEVAPREWHVLVTEPYLD